MVIQNEIVPLRLVTSALRTDALGWVPVEQHREALMAEPPGILERSLVDNKLHFRLLVSRARNTPRQEVCRVPALECRVRAVAPDPYGD